MRSFIKIFLSVILVSSCDEVTELDLRQTPPSIIIEGMVTDKPGYQGVKVSRSTHFYGSGQTPRVENATVTVRDDAGQEITFIHNPSDHPDSLGIYIPEAPFTGEIGRTYTLLVAVDGEQFQASDKLLPVSPVDALEFRINEDEEEDPNEPGKIYEVLLYAREPRDEENYYLFKWYRNDSLMFYSENDVYFSDDTMLAENINGVPSPVYYGTNDTARLELYSLSRNGFIFYNDLSIILTNDGGGMFGPIPASPRTNLSNGALGFFQVSAIQENQTYIQ